MSLQRLYSRMAMNSFVVLGRVGMDLYADPPGTQIEAAGRFTAAIGGSAGNIAVALARQGAKATLLTRVSQDAVGRYCLAELGRYGVATGHVGFARAEARTSLAVVETIAEGPQTVLYRNDAADFALTEADVAAVDFSMVAALVVTGTALAREPSRAACFAAIAAARAAGAIVVLDIDHRAYSWASDAQAGALYRDAAASADIVIGNDDEFGLMAGDYAKGQALAQALATSGALVSIYKRGGEGAVSYTADAAFETGIFKVTAQKPMGAGDGFMGGFLAGLARGHMLEAAVARGAATAAIIVAGVGCAPASPDTAALDAFLQSYS
ncbi:PfkB family carbohydrate kinase [Cypionkella sp.]|uniref:PfkB family carbohydrate kinase n=1 Tax=Cypionkella sp. TaxID=2811411 RepID=UPI0037506361